MPSWKNELNPLSGTVIATFVPDAQNQLFAWTSVLFREHQVRAGREVLRVRHGGLVAVDDDALERDGLSGEGRGQHDEDENQVAHGGSPGGHDPT